MTVRLRAAAARAGLEVLRRSALVYYSELNEYPMEAPTRVA